MKNIALMVIDMQEGLVKDHPYNERKVIENIKKLLKTARENNLEIVYVRHDDGQGTDLAYGTDAWQVYSEIKPEKGEYIVEKTYNSAFHKTDLREYLNSKNIDTVILTGMQTEYCIDATLKSAFDYEYEIIIPEETNTTFDNEYMTGGNLYEFYNYKIWNKRYAKVMPVEDVIKLMK